MTDRPTNGEQKPQAETSGIRGFAQYNVRDSFSVPATDTTSAGGAPDTGCKASQRISRRQLMETDRRLGERDRELLGAVQKYRYLMTGQIQRLLFTGSANSSAGLRAASRSLRKLKSLGLVDSLSRRIGGVRAGSSSLVWYLTHAGERLLRLRSSQAFPVRRHFEPSPYFLAHTLAVAETAIQLVEICRAGHGLKLAALQLEPECWRAYSSIGVSLSLKPDLYAAVVSEEYEDRYFFEIDLDTESPAKVIEKCQKYHAYYRSGLEQKEHGMFPLTVWTVPSAARKEKLIRCLRERFDKQPKLFAVITGEELGQLVRDGGDAATLC